MSQPNAEAAVGSPPSRRIWQQAYRQAGRVPCQHPEFVRASAAGESPVHFESGVLLSAFVRRGPDRADCLVAGAGGFLGEDTAQNVGPWLVETRAALAVDILYFPLLYPDLTTARRLLAAPSGRRLERRPSPVIDWSRRGEDLFRRCEERLGSRARRRRQRFERAGLAVRWLEPTESRYALDYVERRSWKADCGQDMHGRGQFDLYAQLAKTGAATIRAVFDGPHPVAYRLDMRAGEVVYCVKWSFDETYRSVSPGFYLLACDLPVSYPDRSVTTIDLYGSPDTLKGALASGVRQRWDLAWPDGSVATRILDERQAHDAAQEQVYRRSGGIREAYGEMT